MRQSITNPPARRPRRAAILLGAVLAAIFIVPAYAGFRIEGRLAGLPPGSVLQLLREDIDARAQTVEGSMATAADGAFAADFSGEAGYFTLALPDGANAALAIDAGQTLSIAPAPEPATKGIAVTGSPDTNALRAYELFRKESLERLVYPPRAAVREANAAGADPQRVAQLVAAEVEGYEAHRRELNDFAIDHVGPSVALYATSLRWDRDHRLAELSETVATFAAKRPDLAITASMQQRLTRFAGTAIGGRAPEIAGVSLEGEALSLGAFRGKVTLVDFWASWCLPCRVENRNYPALRDRFRDAGFEILAVNLDESRERAAAATQRDRVTWPQIVDDRGWASPIAAAYDVSALPASFLLDEEGRVIARDLRGDALVATLEKLLPRETQ